MKQTASSRTTKILMLTEAYLPWSGGSRVYYHNLLSRLSQLPNYFIRVLTTHCAGDQAFDATVQTESLVILRRGKRLPSMHYRFWFAAWMKIILGLWQTLSWRPDIIYCGDLFPQGVAAYLANRLFGTPYLIFVHGDEISQTNRRRHAPRLRNAIYRGATAVIAANPFAYKLVAEITGADKVSLIKPGVDKESFYPSSGELPQNGAVQLRHWPVILTVGRLCPRKGQRNVLAILPDLLQEFPDLLWMVVGDGPDRDLLEGTVEKLGIRDHVTFAGDVPHEQVATYYRSCDLFVMINRTEANGDIESFGMVFVEAGACGKAVVGGRSGGTCDAILEGETGLLAEPESLKDISEKVLQLLRNHDMRQQMEQTAVECAHRHFDWDKGTEILDRVTRSISGTAGVRPQLKTTGSIS